MNKNQIQNKNKNLIKIIIIKNLHFCQIIPKKTKKKKSKSSPKILKINLSLKKLSEKVEDYVIKKKGSNTHLNLEEISQV